MAASDDNARHEREFMRALLDDLQALESMLSCGQFEVGRRRIGAEQEMFLVDRQMNPAPVSMDVLSTAGDPRLTTELARFNLEANATPQLWGGNCLSEMEAELDQLLLLAREAAREHGAEIVLAGILPTLREEHLGLEYMTPEPRYAAVNDATTQLRGGAFEVSIEGIDELHTRCDSVMLEACNTSFQLHFQVAPDEFAQLYNAAQLVAGPVLAAAVNAPLLLGRRLWHETRIALFAQGVDSRSSAHQARAAPARVSFGDAWVKDSVLEIFRDQVARHRVVLPIDQIEASQDVLARGDVPRLAALCAHNGTVYRWNRACYGISDGIAHLRIENRTLPAGPTVRDQVANAALYFGLLSGVVARHGNVAQALPFEVARDNFAAAARRGLSAQQSWIDGRTRSAAELIREQLLPLAREGLAAGGIDDRESERYLGVIAARVDNGQTGARWMLDSLARMGDASTADIRARALTASMRAEQTSGRPVHEWELAQMPEDDDWRGGFRTVGQFMSRDLFTVRETDLVDLAASVMDWRHIEHVPVENDQGQLVGLLTYRVFLRMLSRGATQDVRQVAVSEVMKRDPVTCGPETPTIDAMQVMRERKVGCLPVVDEGRLVGIVTQSDLIEVSARLLEDYLKSQP